MERRAARHHRVSVIGVKRCLALERHLNVTADAWQTLKGRHNGCLQRAGRGRRGLGVTKRLQRGAAEADRKGAGGKGRDGEAVSIRY